MSLYCFFFFFSSRRRHTRSDRDWSSDVCSSDLVSGVTISWSVLTGGGSVNAASSVTNASGIGRASCREKSVDLGGRRIIKKKRRQRHAEVHLEENVETERLAAEEAGGNGGFFFFSSRRRHTRSDRDWSSDVCSSDLRSVVASRAGLVTLTAPEAADR